MESLFNNTNVVFLEDGDFDSKSNLKGRISKPVFVGVLSTSCPWCHKVAPELEKLSRSKDIVVAVIVDPSVGSKLLSKVGATGVPTFLLYENGKLTSVYNGDRNSASFKRFILG